jgi:hypothetical protein
MTTEEDPRPVTEKEPVARRSRSFLLSVLCLFSFAAFGLLSLLFLAGLFNAGWITEVMNQYLPEKGQSRGQTLLFFLAGSGLHGAALAGSILIWRLRRAGYYLLGLSCLLIAAYQLFNPATAVSSTALYIAALFLFGLFYHRLH